MNIQGWFPLGLTGLISLQGMSLDTRFFSKLPQVFIVYSQMQLSGEGMYMQTLGRYSEKELTRFFCQFHEKCWGIGMLKEQHGVVKKEDVENLRVLIQSCSGPAVSDHKEH